MNAGHLLLLIVIFQESLLSHIIEINKLADYVICIGLSNIHMHVLKSSISNYN